MSTETRRGGGPARLARVWSWWTRHPALAAAAIYAVLSLLFLGPSLLPHKTLSNSDVLWFSPPFVADKPAQLQTPSNPELGDAVTQLQLFLHHSARDLPHIPLWDPYIAGGRPFQANSQSAVFGPYSLPAYVLPFWTALGWIGVLKLWVGAFGTYLLGRALGMRFGGALLAGIVFALSLKMVTWISYPHMSVWTFIPWLLLLTDRLVRRPTLLAGCGMAAIVALQFLSGHAESSFHVLMAATAFLALRLWQNRRESGAVDWRPVLAYAGALAGGAALAAVSLVPFVELLLHSADLHDRGGQSIDVSLDLKEAIGIALPDWWGRSTQTPIRLFLLERALYIGALPLMLIGVALLRPRLERVAVALFGFLWLAVVLGIPPFLQIVTRLPIFSSGHNTRLIILAVFSGALLAGWGFDDLARMREASPRQLRLILMLSGAIFAIPLIAGAAIQHPTAAALRGGLKIAWLFQHPPGEFRNPLGLDQIRMSALIMWLTLAGAGLALVVLRARGKLAATPFVVLGVLLVCIDLFRAGMGFNPAIDQKYAEPPRTEAVRFLQAHRPARFAGTEQIPQNVLPFEFGLYEARGYDLPIMQRYDRLWRREVMPQFQSVAGGLANVALELREPTPAAMRTLRFLGVKYVLGPKSTLATPPDRSLVPVPPLSAPGLKLVYDRPDARIYEVERAMPRTWVVGAQQVVGSGEAARNVVTSPSFDAHRVAVTEHRLSGLPSAASTTGTARIASYRDEKVVVRATSSGRGLLVLGDNWYPGWKAKVDGKPADVEQVDYLFRGVPIAAGTHTVEFSYEPASWRIGWVTSLLSLIALAALTLVGWRRRRR